MPGRQELPSTLERSPKKAQRTWIEAHDSADHWEPKEGGRKGPSDPQSARPRQQGGRSGEGVDEQASMQHLRELARRLDVPGRSKMNKAQLLDAIRKANRRETRERQPSS
jgi:hypothetical protein